MPEGEEGHGLRTEASGGRTPAVPSAPGPCSGAGIQQALTTCSVNEPSWLLSTRSHRAQILRLCKLKKISEPLLIGRRKTDAAHRQDGVAPPAWGQVATLRNVLEDLWHGGRCPLRACRLTPRPAVPRSRTPTLSRAPAPAAGPREEARSGEGSVRGGRSLKELLPGSPGGHCLGLPASRRAGTAPCTLRRCDTLALLPQLLFKPGRERIGPRTPPAHTDVPTLSTSRCDLTGNRIIANARG